MIDFLTHIKLVEGAIAMFNVKSDYGPTESRNRVVTHVQNLETIFKGFKSINWTSNIRREKRYFSCLVPLFSKKNITGSTFHS